MLKLIVAFVLISSLSAREIQLQCEYHRSHVGKDIEKSEFVSISCDVPKMNSTDEELVITSNSLDLNPIIEQNAYTEVILNRKKNHPYIFPTGVGKNIPRMKNFRYEFGSLKFIKRENFADMELLEALSFLKNNIETIAADSFHDLPNLINVNLALNKIKVIPVELFANSLKLEDIDIQCNDLKELSDDLLVNLPELKVFRAGNNSLTEISGKLFRNNPNIEAISLRHNQIKKIAVSFNNFAEISMVNLFDNLGECSFLFDEEKPTKALYYREDLTLWQPDINVFQGLVDEKCNTNQELVISET